MSIIIDVILPAMLLYISIMGVIWVIASQCLSAVQGSEAGERLQTSIVKMKPSTFMLSLGDGHPSDSRVWFALRQARDLPDIVQRKARIIGWLYEVDRLIFALMFSALVVCFVLQFFVDLPF